MVQGLAATEIRQFLERLSEEYTKPVKVYLLGGSALCFLGSPRRTVDIDCTADVTTEEFELTVEAVAQELKLEIEIIPIEEFIPLPAAAQSRHKSVGQFGNLQVYVFDPYSIALSKLARGFDADIQDVLFLLQSEIINLGDLSRVVEEALPRAWDYDIDPKEMSNYLEVVKILYQKDRS